MASASSYDIHPLSPPPAVAERGFRHEPTAENHYSPSPHHIYSQQGPPLLEQSPAGSRHSFFRFPKSLPNSPPQRHSRHSRLTFGDGSDLHETHEERESYRLHSKADPTLAMNEAEPSAVAQEITTLTSLGSIQHKDRFGQPIAEPDRSNPTRDRWERPLDTILGFEGDVDRSYQNRSYRKLLNAQTQNEAVNVHVRSTLSLKNYPIKYSTGYYRQSEMRRPNSDIFYSGQPYNMRRGSRPPRVNSDVNLLRPDYRGGIYPPQHQDRSCETVTTSGSGSFGEPAGYQTDPTSSEGGSTGRQSPQKESSDNYGISFSQPVSLRMREEPSPQSPPASLPPSKDALFSELPPPAAAAALQKSQESPQPTSVEEKAQRRKSWFSRRFSRSKA